MYSSLFATNSHKQKLQILIILWQLFGYFDKADLLEGRMHPDLEPLRAE